VVAVVVVVIGVYFANSSWKIHWIFIAGTAESCYRLFVLKSPVLHGIKHIVLYFISHVLFAKCNFCVVLYLSFAAWRLTHLLNTQEVN
jgi:hypothetical protein